jgi:tRNA A37 N6-isopentenylltransferase MiaA
MRRTFFIVGPTATGKCDLVADVAREMRAEIVSRDAFQIYRGLDLLTAKRMLRRWQKRRITSSARFRWPKSRAP